MQTAILHSSLPEGNTPPAWLHLVPAGTFKGVDGRGPYHLKDPAGVIAASMAAGKIPVDENHATEHARSTGQPSPARGWIVAMEARPDGIWGRVEWTETGAAMMSERAYRGVSPVIHVDPKSGVVGGIASLALTNTPNLAGLKTLHTQDAQMDLAALRAALGLPDTADEAAVLARVAANATTAATLATELQTARAAAGEAQTMAQQVVQLQTQLQTVQVERAREKAVAYVDGAIRAGKPIAPLRDHFVTRHMADPAAVETEIGALPVLNTAAEPGTFHLQSAGGDDMATEMESAVAKKMGLDPKKMAAHRKAMAAMGGGTPLSPASMGDK